MRTTGIVLIAGSTALLSACAEPPNEAREIIDNLVHAGFPADDIMVVDGTVYVGRDARVTLAASREMIQDAGAGPEQYRTSNLIRRSLTKICIDGPTFTGVFSAALDLAIQNYDEQPLTFAMARTPSAGCSFTINAVLDPGVVGGSAGFPAGGLPFGQIKIGDGLAVFPLDTIEHVITHEIGHTIGFRHADFFNRSISCGGPAIHEGDVGIGAIFIPGTRGDAVVGGSIMNSCFRQVETGEFTGTDVVALTALYNAIPAFTLASGDFDGDGRADYMLHRNDAHESNVYLGNGDGSFRTRVLASQDGVRYPDDFALVTGDFTGDGRADYLLHRHNPHESNVYVGRGDGTFAARALSSQDGLPYTEDFALAPGDFNGDGRLDYMLHRNNAHESSVYFSLGDGRFAPRVLSSQDGLPYTRDFALVTGDFNGDGLTDYMLHRNNAHESSVYFSLGDGRFAPRVLSSQDGLPYSRDFKLLPGDFNGDGRTDYILHRNNAHESSVYLALGDGRFATRVLSSQDGLPYGTTYDLMVSDFNGDGASDYLLHLKARHESSVYRSLRNGAFAPRVLSSQDGFDYP